MKDIKQEVKDLFESMEECHKETEENTGLEGIYTFDEQEEEFYWELGYIRAMEEVLDLINKANKGKTK